MSSPNQHNSPLANDEGSHVRNLSDPFDDALDIVLSARNASQQAKRAREKAATVDELSEKVHANAESLNRIAINLAATAASVASSALRICGYESFENAYEINPEYNKKLSLEDLTKLLSDNDTFSLKALSYDLPSSNEIRGRIIQPKDAWAQPDMKKKAIAKNTQLDALPNRDSIDLIDFGNEVKVPSSGSRRHTLGTVPQPAPGTFRPIKDDDYNSSGTDKSVKKSTENEEKFVSSVGATIRRGSLAASFDSTNAITPLWEDRYVDDTGKVHIHTIFSPEQKWSDKKAMRQFQMKLQKAKLDSGSSHSSANMSRDSLSPGPSTQRVIPKKKERDVDSSDSEVEDILVAPKPLRQLRESERNSRTGTQRLHPRNSDITSPRAVSPLLSNNERGCYKVSGDEKSPITSPLPHTKPRHIYKPEASPDASHL